MSPWKTKALDLNIELWNDLDLEMSPHNNGIFLTDKMNSTVVQDMKQNLRKKEQSTEFLKISTSISAPLFL